MSGQKANNAHTLLFWVFIAQHLKYIGGIFCGEAIKIIRFIQTILNWSPITKKHPPLEVWLSQINFNLKTVTQLKRTKLLIKRCSDILLMFHIEIF